MDIYQFWRDVLEQNADALKGYFDEHAYINWHCTNEQFNVDEFIIANCEYPGEWQGEVERVETRDDFVITVAHVYPKDRTLSFHVTSFIKVVDDKIVAVDEYWAEDGVAPDWRLHKQIGKAIKGNDGLANTLREKALVVIKKEAEINDAPFCNDLPLVYLGEIANMPEHGIFIGKSGKCYFGYHIWNFRELRDDEI